MQPLISIITPMFNNEKVIKQTISSVLKQTYSKWEMLLIDDASMDNTLDIVENFKKKDSRIKLFVHKENKGAAEARNLGTKMAKGSFIAFLDADDLWRENKLELQINYLNNNITDVSFGSYEWVNSESKPLNKKTYVIKELSYNKLLKANYIGNLTGMYNCEKLGKIYTKDLKKRQDWLLWLEALKRSDKPAIGISETIAYYRVTKGSLSFNKWNLIKYNFDVFYKGLGYSSLKSYFYLLRFLYEHLFVKSRLIKTINLIQIALIFRL